MSFTLGISLTEVGSNDRSLNQWSSGDNITEHVLSPPAVDTYTGQDLDELLRDMPEHFEPGTPDSKRRKIKHDIPREKYNDPTAKITLRSNQGVIFRVHEYKLKAFSNTLKDMFDMCERALAADEKADPVPIDIEATTAELTLFLDFMDDKPARGSLALDQIEKTLQLCDQFDCPVIISLVLAHLDAHLSSNPWKVFVLAAKHDRLDLAKRAIASFDNKNAGVERRLKCLTRAQASEISVAYILPLIRLRLEGDRHAYPPHKELGWKQVAERFSPLD